MAKQESVLLENLTELALNCVLLTVTMKLLLLHTDECIC